MLAVHFHHCRMFAEYRRVQRAMICFIHFSHSKFITFRKTDSFIPRVLKLFSATVLDINDYGKIAIDSRTNFATIAARSVLDRPSGERKIKCCICGDSELNFTIAGRNARPGYLGVVNSKCIIQRSIAQRASRISGLRSLTNVMWFRMLLNKIHLLRTKSPTFKPRDLSSLAVILD